MVMQRFMVTCHSSELFRLRLVWHFVIVLHLSCAYYRLRHTLSHISVLWCISGDGPVYQYPKHSYQDLV